MTPEEIWRRKSDEELLAAAERLDEYTEIGQRIILAEVDRRKTPEYRANEEAAEQRFEDEQRVLAKLPPVFSNPPLGIRRSCPHARGLHGGQHA